MKEIKVSAEDIINLRLANQQLIKTDYGSPADLVQWFAAMQAQDYPAAKWAVGLRIPGCNDDDLENAVAQRQIIRSWPMRGTIHFTAAGDLRWIISLTAEKVQRSMSARLAQLELPSKKLIKCINRITAFLDGGKHASREELADYLRQGKIEINGMQLSHILLYAALEKLVCFGVKRGKKFTYTLLDEWAPGTVNIEGGQALAELTKRYFLSRGPAAIQDFVWWSGLTVSDAKRGISMCADILQKITHDSREYWLAVETQGIPPRKQQVFLLPWFDEFLVAYKNRQLIQEDKFAKKINAGGGMLNPVVLVNGKAAGTWKRNIKSKNIIIEFSFFNSPAKTILNKAGMAAEDYGRFYNLPVILSGK